MYVMWYVVLYTPKFHLYQSEIQFSTVAVFVVVVLSLDPNFNIILAQLPWQPGFITHKISRRGMGGVMVQIIHKCNTGSTNIDCK